MREPRRGALVRLGSWAVSLIGSGLWVYGYFAAGTPSVVDWPALLPHWAAGMLPNLEAEVGLVLVIVASVPLYLEHWRALRDGNDVHR